MSRPGPRVVQVEEQSGAITRHHLSDGRWIVESRKRSAAARFQLYAPGGRDSDNGKGTGGRHQFEASTMSRVLKWARANNP